MKEKERRQDALLAGGRNSGERGSRARQSPPRWPLASACAEEGSISAAGHLVPRPNVPPFVWQKDVKSYFIRGQPPAWGFLHAWWKAWNHHLKGQVLQVQAEVQVLFKNLLHFHEQDFGIFKANFKNQVIISHFKGYLPMVDHIPMSES